MSLWVVVYAAGAAQGALLALALWRRATNTASNRVLAVWIALAAVDLAAKALHLHDPGPETVKLFRLAGLLPFLYGSLFYLYVRTLTQALAPTWRDRLHLAGFAGALLLTADLFLLDAEATRNLYARWQGGERPARVFYLDLALFFYSLSYVGGALVLVKRYRRELMATRSDADGSALRWIEVMAVSQIAIWCTAVAHWLASVPLVDYMLIYGAVVAWIFAVGYISLNQAPVDGAGAVPPSPAQVIDDPRFPAVEARLAMLMQEQALYREPALAIGQLARRSGYPEYLVSAVINRRLGRNFWEYVNRYRIEAARACLADRDDQRSVLEIAYDCGFTSKSTFNAAFKRQVGATPSEYRQRHARAG